MSDEYIDRDANGDWPAADDAALAAVLAAGGPWNIDILKMYGGPWLDIDWDQILSPNDAMINRDGVPTYPVTVEPEKQEDPRSRALSRANRHILPADVRKFVK